MDRRFRGIRLLIGALVVCGVNGLNAAELPTVAEILAIHRANLEKLSQLHLQLVHTQETTEAACRAAQIQADQMEESVKAFARLTPVDIKALEIEVDGKKIVGDAAYKVISKLGFKPDDPGRQKEILRLRANKPWQRFEPIELFLNGEDYQVRRPLRDFRTHGQLAEWAFSAVSLTAESLFREYGESRIHSWCSTSSPPMRWWSGGKHNTGYVSCEHFGKHNGAELPPFTGILHPVWDNGHLIDTFFLSTEENYRVVKQEEVDGRLLTVVDTLVPQNERSPRMLLRGWIDVERGAVPLKVFETQVIATGKLDSFDLWKPSDFLGSNGTITATTVIRQLPNGGFYPARTVREDLGQDADAPKLSDAEWAEVQAGKRDRPASVVHRRHVWDCKLVEIKTDWDAGFFLIPFPKGQKIYDFDSEKVLGALEPKPLIRVGQTAPPLTIARWIDGQDRTLNDFKGQVVVLDFWGLWCGACRSAVPRLKDLQSKFDDQPVTFISIHSAEDEPLKLAAKISAFAKEQDWKFVASIDAGKMLEDSATTVEYGIQSFPTTVIIGPDGKIIYVDPDLDGPACNEEDGRVLAEFQKKLNKFFEGRFAAVGETWPLSAGLDEEETNKIYERVEQRYIIQQIEQALKIAAKP